MKARCTGPWAAVFSCGRKTGSCRLSGPCRFAEVVEQEKVAGQQAALHRQSDENRFSVPGRLYTVFSTDEALKRTRTVEELRQAQAVILPLEFGFPWNEQVAMVTGIFKGWVCQLRNRFLRLAGVPDPEKRKPGGGRHENMGKEEETAFLLLSSKGQPEAACWSYGRSGRRSLRTWAALFPCPRSTICCTAITGANSLRTSGTSGPIPGHRQTGKKFPESPATVGSHGLERDLCVCCFRMRPVLAGSRRQGGAGVHGRIALYAGPW